MKMKELYEKIAGDSELQTRMAEILKNAKGQEEAQEALLKFAKELGGDVTIDEVRAFFEGMAVTGELSEEELDMVAGGKATEDSLILSIFSVGVLCAFASLYCKYVVAGGCEGFFVE